LLSQFDDLNNCAIEVSFSCVMKSRTAMYNDCDFLGSTERSHMTSSSNPEIAELWEKLEQLDKEIAEVRASINRLNKIVRANIRQAVWQSIVLFISVCLAVAGGLAYQTSVLNKRFAQMEKDWKESDRRFAERSKLSEENLKTYLDQSEKNRTTPSDNLKPKVRVRRK